MKQHEMQGAKGEVLAEKVCRVLDAVQGEPPPSDEAMGQAVCEIGKVLFVGLFRIMDALEEIAYCAKERELRERG